MISKVLPSLGVSLDSSEMTSILLFWDMAVSRLN